MANKATRVRLPTGRQGYQGNTAIKGYYGTFCLDRPIAFYSLVAFMPFIALFALDAFNSLNH